MTHVKWKIPNPQQNKREDQCLKLQKVYHKKQKGKQTNRIIELKNMRREDTQDAKI